MTPNPFQINYNQKQQFFSDKTLELFKHLIKSNFIILWNVDFICLIKS